MKVLLADEYGFCFGVERAVEMVDQPLELVDARVQLGVSRQGLLLSGWRA